MNDQLQPRPGDATAEYTHEAYDLDDARKVARRQARRELLTDRLALPGRLEVELVEILRLADPLRRSDLRRFASVLHQISAIRRDARRAMSDIKRYQAIPGDAPLRCRCVEPANRSVPRELERQWLDVPEPVF